MAGDQYRSDEAVDGKDTGKDAGQKVYRGDGYSALVRFGSFLAEHLLRTAISGLSMPAENTPALLFAVP